MFSNCSYAYDDSFDGIDFNFIDTAFDGIQPVTNKQFNDTINKLTPQPVEDSFGGKLKAFLFGRKYGVETPPVKQQDLKTDIGGEKKAIEDMKNGVYYIKLLVSVVGYDGNIIPLGNYKIKEETDEYLEEAETQEQEEVNKEIDKLLLRAEKAVNKII